MSGLYEILPFTLLDFPGEMACVAWFAKCNMRCVYCHNPDVVKGEGKKEETELISFLETRQGKLSGVVFSGGEATLYPGLTDLIRRVKEMGFKTKLDTNGSRPEIVKNLVEEELLDYVAMDYKAPEDRLEDLIGTAKWWQPFRESLAYLIKAKKEKGLGFEVRTTVHPDLLSEDEINTMIEDLDSLGYEGTYFIQLIASYGDKTIGNVAEPMREMRKEKLIKPQNFTLGFRNFSDS